MQAESLTHDNLPALPSSFPRLSLVELFVSALRIFKELSEPEVQGIELPAHLLLCSWCCLLGLHSLRLLSAYDNCLPMTVQMLETQFCELKTGLEERRFMERGTSDRCLAGFAICRAIGLSIYRHVDQSTNRSVSLSIELLAYRSVNLPSRKVKWWS